MDTGQRHEHRPESWTDSCPLVFLAFIAMPVGAVIGFGCWLFG